MIRSVRRSWNVFRPVPPPPITDLLERNAHEFCHETALVEINPEVKEIRRVTWKEYELIESSPTESYRREITWGVFD